MNIKSYLIVAMVLLATACTNSTAKNQQTEEQQSIPEGAVEMKYNRHAYFKVMLRDSIPARMIFDTGSNNLLIDSTFYASTFGEGKNLGRAMLGGAGNGHELTTLDASGWSYSIGEESHTEQMAIIMNLRKILGDGADGLFGLPFMHGKRVEFNYASEYMRFLATDEKVGNDFIAIQCKKLDNIERIIIPLSVTFSDGYALNGNFLMDTGMPDELSLNSATANRLKAEGHLANARRMKFEVGGIGGSRTDNYLTTKQITIGGKSINNIRITYSENEKGSLADSRYDGLVGNALFARFDVIIDFVNWVIYLRPNKNFDKPQPNFYSMAFTPNGDHWKVNALLEGGNAERAGLRQGDRIEAINGIKASDSDKSALSPLPDRLTLSVVRGGETIEIIVDKE